LIDHPVVQAVLGFLDSGLLDATGWQIVAYTLLATHVTIAAVTIYLHRCQAHRALDLHPVVSHFFRAWLWLTTGMVTKEWTAIHRKHHAKCETEDDPHSPQTRGIRKVLLEGAELYREESRNPETMVKYGHGTPDDWVERNVYTRFPSLGITLTLLADVAMFGVIGITVFAIQMLWIPVTAAGIINGLGHWWGYRNFDSPDAATNVLPWGILIGGEELHNNHHAFASSAKLSNRWYEFDVGWMYIRILQALGLATVRKVAPVPKFTEQPRPAVDLHTLQAVIAHRYDPDGRVRQVSGAGVLRGDRPPARRAPGRREPDPVGAALAAPGRRQVERAASREARRDLRGERSAEEARRDAHRAVGDLGALEPVARAAGGPP
jgi:stearoyl-CoA desaturase (delta-9 desaturase)